MVNRAGQAYNFGPKLSLDPPTGVSLITSDFHVATHWTGVLSGRGIEASATPILRAQMAPFRLTRPKEPLPDRWIQA